VLKTQLKNNEWSSSDGHFGDTLPSPVATSSYNADRAASDANGDVQTLEDGSNEGKKGEKCIRAGRLDAVAAELASAVALAGATTARSGRSHRKERESEGGKDGYFGKHVSGQWVNGSAVEDVK
jgi:hypothetical protein